MSNLSKKQKMSLIEEAQKARKLAYAPYSKYAVGAALMTNSGEIITGGNVENAAYPTSICAERVAIFTAVAQGVKEFKAIAVVTKNGGTPCGSCRQVMAEFNPEMEILIADEEGNIHQETTLKEILPGYFGPKSLA